MPRRFALIVGVGLLLAALAIGWLVSLEFVGILALYLVLTTGYSAWLKDVPIVDLAVVASGFLIRAVAGGIAVDVPISRWFLIVTSFGSLFMVIGKRLAEQVIAEGEVGATRKTLTTYSRSYLQSMSTMAAAVTVTAYCLWAFEQSEGLDFPWYELTIIPFVLSMLRYGLLLDAGCAGAPEDVFLGDRSLQILGVVWVVMFGLAVYVGK